MSLLFFQHFFWRIYFPVARLPKGEVVVCQMHRKGIFYSLWATVFRMLHFSTFLWALYAFFVYFLVFRKVLLWLTTESSECNWNDVIPLESAWRHHMDDQLSKPLISPWSCTQKCLHLFYCARRSRVRSESKLALKVSNPLWHKHTNTDMIHSSCRDGCSSTRASITRDYTFPGSPEIFPITVWLHGLFTLRATSK